MAGTRIKDMVSFNSRLYAYTGNEVFQSINGGRTWKGVRVGDEQEPPELIAKEPSGIHPSFDSKLVITGNALYLDFTHTEATCGFSVYLRMAIY